LFDYSNRLPLSKNSQAIRLLLAGQTKKERKQMRTLTEEQKAKSAARKEKFRAFAKQVSAMTDEQRAELAGKMKGLRK
jgi:hypothetical protein